MNKKYRICFLGYQILSDLARNVIDSLDLPDTEVYLADCNVETLHATVESAVTEGYEMFVAGSANAAEFRRHFHQHLVEISLRPVDYLIAIKKALSLGSKPVLAVYRYGRQLDLPLLENLSGVSLRTIVYEDTAGLHHGILESDGDVIVGAGHANKLAAELSRKSVLLYPGEDSIRSAIRRARTLCAELEREMQKTRIVQTILNDAPIGLIVTDAAGRVSLFNRAARQYSQTRNEKMQGRYLSDLLPSLSPETFLESGERQSDQRRLVNGAMMRCVHVRIQDRDRFMGVLTTLYPDNTRKKKADVNPAEKFRAAANFSDAAGSSPALEQAFRAARQAAESEYPLVITGEPGTGRNFLAQCVHNVSRERKEPFVRINLAALPDQDAARVLFGSESDLGLRQGLLELAEKGTVVLSNLSLATRPVQECLLQAVKEGRFLRLGGITPVPLATRIILIAEAPQAAVTTGAAATAGPAPTATNTAVPPGILPGLWHLLSVLKVEVPPLRERREEIPALFRMFAAQEAALAGRPRALKTSEEVLRYYSWPGNLNELSAVSRRYTTLSAETASITPVMRHQLLIQAIGEENLFREILSRHPALRNAAKSPAEELLAGLRDLKQILKYNNSTIAERLSLSRTTLWRLTNEKED